MTAILLGVTLFAAWMFCVWLPMWVLRQYVNAIYEEQRVRAKLLAKELREIGERLSAVEVEPTDVDDDEPQPVAVYGYVPPPPSDTCDTIHVLHGKPFIVSMECEP
jgi:hypothetical protein